MSKLILTGDTNNNFGKLLPAPYIDKIYINETSEITTEETEVEGAWVYDVYSEEPSVWVESGTTTITTLAGASTAIIDVDIEIYIRAEENTDITTLAKQLENLRITWFYVSTDSFDWDLDDLKDKKENIWAFYKQAIDEVPNCAAVFLLSDIIYDDTGALTHTIVYDDEGYRALKFKYSSKDAVESLVVYNGSTVADVWSEEDEDEEEVEGDIYLFAYATFDDPTTDEDATSFWYEYGGDYDDRHGKFLTIETGDTAYDAVWVDGEPAWGEQIIWVDGDDNLYDDVPLQSLSSKYYSIEKMTHSEIVSSFEDLLESYETKAEADDILQDTMDQVSYILETNGADINLLSQLNKLSRAFPSKSSATATGLLYIDYNKKISAANAVIETGTQVYRKVMINSKVVDEREGEESEFTGVEYASAEGEDIERTTNINFDDDDYFVTNMVIGRTYQQAEDWTETGDVRYTNYGYVFFDYEKAVYETAGVGHSFHMDTIYNLLGPKILNGYFKLINATLTRVYVEDDGDEWWSRGVDAAAEEYPNIEMVSTFEDGYDIKNVSWEDTGTEDGWISAHSSPFVFDEHYIAYSFLLLRNFELAGSGAGGSSEGWGGYRMMCFEIQDFEEMDYWGQTSYKFNVTIEDSSKQLALDMIDAYKNLYATGGTFDEYYNTAIDPANYSSEEKWTDSFQALMHDIYDEDEGKAPWIFYPTYYCVYLDLATSEFSGDSEKIADEVNRIASRINPYNGSLSELESFYEDFKALAEEGALATIYEDLDTGDGTADSYDKTYNNTFSSADWPWNAATSQDALEYRSSKSLSATAAYAARESAEASDLGAGLPTISPSFYNPSDAEFDVDPEADLKARYKDYGSSESSGFYINGEQIADGDWVTDYFKLEKYALDGWAYNWEDDDFTAIGYAVQAKWFASSFSFRARYVSAGGGFDASTTYRWSLSNTDNAITDEHGSPLGDWEIKFST